MVLIYKMLLYSFVCCSGRQTFGVCEPNLSSDTSNSDCSCDTMKRSVSGYHGTFEQR